MVTSDAVTGRPTRDGTCWRDLTLQSDSTGGEACAGVPGSGTVSSGPRLHGGRQAGGSLRGHPTISLVKGA